MTRGRQIVCLWDIPESQRGAALDRGLPPNG